MLPYFTHVSEPKDIPLWYGQQSSKVERDEDLESDRPAYNDDNDDSAMYSPCDVGQMPKLQWGAKWGRARTVFHMVVLRTTS